MHRGTDFGAPCGMAIYAANDGRVASAGRRGGFGNYTVIDHGIIGGKYPGMDMISFGPTICYPHSPDEKVDIASVGRFYEFLVHTLENVPQK